MQEILRCCHQLCTLGREAKVGFSPLYQNDFSYVSLNRTMYGILCSRWSTLWGILGLEIKTYPTMSCQFECNFGNNNSIVVCACFMIIVRALFPRSGFCIWP